MAKVFEGTQVSPACRAEMCFENSVRSNFGMILTGDCQAQIDPCILKL